MRMRKWENPTPSSLLGMSRCLGAAGLKALVVSMVEAVPMALVVCIVAAGLTALVGCIVAASLITPVACILAGGLTALVGSIRGTDLTGTTALTASSWTCCWIRGGWCCQALWGLGCLMLRGRGCPKLGGWGCPKWGGQGCPKWGGRGWCRSWQGCFSRRAGRGLCCRGTKGLSQKTQVWPSMHWWQTVVRCPRRALQTWQLVKTWNKIKLEVINLQKTKNVMDAVF